MSKVLQLYRHVPVQYSPLVKQMALLSIMALPSGWHHQSLCHNAVLLHSPDVMQREL